MTASFSQFPLISIALFLGALVFVHELGHYVVGRLCGIGVEVFALGFGPRLMGFSRGATDFRLCLLPLGGYVKFAGAGYDEPVPEVFAGCTLRDASRWARAATLLAGPGANLLLALGIFSAQHYVGTMQMLPQVGWVLAEGPAERAGVMPGEQIVAVGTQAVETVDEVQQQVRQRPGQDVTLTLKGHEGQRQVRVAVESVKGGDPSASQEPVGRIGVVFGRVPAQLTRSGADQAGPRVLEVNALAWMDESPRSVTDWPELVAALEAAFIAKAKTIRVEGHNLLDAAHPELRFEWDSGAWYHEPALEVTAKGRRGRRLLELLGAEPSSLTLRRKPTGSALEMGDVVRQVAGLPVHEFSDMAERIHRLRQARIAFEVERGDATLSLEVDLEPVVVQREEGPVTLYHLDAEFFGQMAAAPQIIVRADSLSRAVVQGGREVKQHAVAILTSLWRLITGQVSTKALGGPVLIAKIAEQAAAAGFWAYLTTMAVISINLGLVNLIPLPALDGGQLVIVGVEAVRQRRLSPATVEQVQRVGVMLILMLMILATYNDVSRFWLRSLSERP